MRVLHIETGRHLYGGGQQVLQLLRGLYEEDEVQSELACPSHSPLGEAARPFARIAPLARAGDADPRLLWDLRGLLRERPPELVHIHSRRGADLWGLLVARMAGVPVVLTRRVDNPEPGWWARWKYGQCAAVIAISEGIREVLIREGVPAGRISVVPSAVNPQAYSGPCERPYLERELGPLGDGPLIGVIAQLIERKGHRELLDALSRVREDAPGTRVLLLGQGPLEGALRSEASRMGVTDMVRFCGYRTDLDRILPCLDLVVHPARMEGLGVALLEAGAAGVPILATRAGGIPEVVRDGINGVLVPPWDPAALAAALRALLRDPTRRRALGEAGRQRVQERFSPDAMVRGNVAVYRSVLGTETRSVA